MSTATFYHAGCPVCLGAEQMLANAIDSTKYTVKNVHLGQQPERIPEAEAAGVKSVPALVLNGEVFHINFGAAIADLKN
ncbi:MAG: thioredoxin family protein [Methylococcaceae bacterium]|nr:thioredoxin family protein [Methylococcaceae bacterium]